MKGYKGFDKDMRCRGMQFTVGADHAAADAQLCNSGLHWCENPLDCFSYYPPGSSKYGSTEASGTVSGREPNGDSKRCSTMLKVTAQMSIAEIIKAGVEYVRKSSDVAATTGSRANAATTGECANAATTGECANAATTGYRANAATTGYRANAATTGDRANAATTGECANAATTGDRANAATTGYAANAATTGYAANAATTGYAANAATTGSRANAATTGECANAEVSGRHSIAAALGISSMARGALGCWLVLVERDSSYTDDRGAIKFVRAVIVDGNTIKANTWYTLRGGEFVEVE